MSEVGKVMGPSGAPEHESKKTTAADAEKFAEARKRVEQVSPIDPDEQKKRKRQEEAEEEEPLIRQSLEESAAPPPQAPPFMLTQNTPAGLLGSQQGTYPALPSPSSPSSLAPSPYETSFNPPPAEQSSYPSTSSPQSPQTSSSSAPPSTEPTQSSSAPASTASTQPAKEPEKSSKPIPDAAKKIESTQDTTGFFEQLKTKESPIKETQMFGSKEKEVEALIEDGGVPATVPASLSPLAKGVVEEKKKEDPQAALVEGGSPTTLRGSGPPLIKPPETISSLGPYARLTPQVQELFDKMVGVMTVMHLQGLSETTFTLNSPKFASSVFFGSQIIIKEFSTAPQALNIQLNGSMQAVSLFQANADSLMAAFQAGNYNFKINRLETNYITEDRPLFHRKEADDGQQNQGDQTR